MADDGDRLQEFLEKDETVQWSGSTQPYEIFDEAHKSVTLVSVILGLAVGIFIIAGYLWLCASREIEVKPVIIVFALGFALLILWGPIANRRHLIRMKYAITDKRVIAFSTGTGKAFAMPLSALDAVRVAYASPGTCHVLFGSSVAKASGKKLVSLTMHGRDTEGEDKVRVSKGMVFYNISAEAGMTLSALLSPSVIVQKTAA
jgi:hypothetical protein